MRRERRRESNTHTWRPVSGAQWVVCSGSRPSGTPQTPPPHHLQRSGRT